MIELGAALLRAVPPGSAGRILEVGTGSGHTARQLLAHGVELLGIDLSLDKLRQLRSDLPGRLAQADACRLPFPSASLDAVITVHVMHLIDQPALALREFQRVLRPGGAYLEGGKRIESQAIWSEIREQWDRLLAQRRLAQSHGDRSETAVREILSAMGAICDSENVNESVIGTTPAKEIDRLFSRVPDGIWRVPAASLPELRAALLSWAQDRYGQLGAPQSYRVSWYIDRWHF